ncbi:MAG: DUF4932 domain-containing protein, partial [Bacillota bacterium]
MVIGSSTRVRWRCLTAIMAMILVTSGVCAIVPPVLADTAPRFSIEIRPEMELLAGVLAQTDWIVTRGPRGDGNIYYRALKDYLAPYKDHPAVQIAQKLTKQGFAYDAPPAVICHFGPLPNLELKYEYSDYLIKRAGSRQVLEEFRLALKDLAEKSKFHEFVAQWQGDSDSWTKAGYVDGDRVMDWLEGFFGTKMQESHIILAPAMFPAGGYGATVTGKDGETIAFQIIREDGTSTMQPQFQGGGSLNSLTLHEWGHSFVNPTLGKYDKEIQKLNYLFIPVSIPMFRQAYNSVEVFMNEQVLRALTSLAAGEMGTSEDMEREIVYNERRSFYLTRDLVTILREYESSRDRYPTFEAFTPVMVNRLMEMHPPRFWQRWLTERNLIIATALLMVLVLYIIA